MAPRTVVLSAVWLPDSYETSDTNQTTALDSSMLPSTIDYGSDNSKGGTTVSQSKEVVTSNDNGASVKKGFLWGVAEVSILLHYRTADATEIMRDICLETIFYADSHLYGCRCRLIQRRGQST